MNDIFHSVNASCVVGTLRGGEDIHPTFFNQIHFNFFALRGDDSLCCLHSLLSEVVDTLFVLRDSGDTKTTFLHALIPSYSEVVRTFFVPRGGLGTKLSFLHAVHAHKL